MALLATFEDAGILPPEGTPQANGIIKAVIQFQSAFLKSRHPAVQQFFGEAHRRKFGPRAAEIEASFQEGGWSAESFDAVIAAGQTPSVWTDHGLIDAFKEFNIGKPDFDLSAQHGNKEWPTPADPTVLSTLRAFVRAVRESLPPPISIEDGKRAVEIAEACYASAQMGGRLVPVEYA